MPWFLQTISHRDMAWVANIDSKINTFLCTVVQISVTVLFVLVGSIRTVTSCLSSGGSFDAVQTISNKNKKNILANQSGFDIVKHGFH